MRESESAPVDLCVEVLRRLDRAGVLDELVLVGSWCTYFYNRYFEGNAKLSALRTRDMDFLIRRPPKFKANVEISALLKDLGFLPELRPEGCVSMTHPDLIIDFLVAERGRGAEATIPIPALGIRAQPLRFLDFLSSDTIVVNHEGLDIRLPHPATFALHKLIISGRRPKPEKAEKDRNQSLELMDALVMLGRGRELQTRFKDMPAGWQKMVLQAIDVAERPDLKALLKP